MDEDARWWCSAAFAEIERDPGEWRPFSPNPWLGAFKTFAQLSAVASVEEATSFLEFSRTLIPREPRTYRHTDEAQVDATITIGLTYPDLRPTALELLLECLLIDQRMADLVLGKGALTSSDGRLPSPAKRGSSLALRALLVGPARP